VKSRFEDFGPPDQTGERGGSELVDPKSDSLFLLTDRRPTKKAPSRRPASFSSPADQLFGRTVLRPQATLARPRARRNRLSRSLKGDSSSLSIDARLFRGGRRKLVPGARINRPNFSL
jgi:hypothetical protein